MGVRDLVFLPRAPPLALRLFDVCSDADAPARAARLPLRSSAQPLPAYSQPLVTLLSASSTSSPAASRPSLAYVSSPLFGSRSAALVTTSADRCSLLPPTTGYRVCVRWHLRLPCGHLQLPRLPRRRAAGPSLGGPPLAQGLNPALP